MDLKASLSSAAQDLARLALEPERVDAWAAAAARWGVPVAEVWKPRDLSHIGPDLGVRARYFCYGRITFGSGPFARIDLMKARGAVGYVSDLLVTARSRQRVRYEDRLVAAHPAPNGPPQATWALRKRLLGLVRGPDYHWRGGLLARRLESDDTLRVQLALDGEGPLSIEPVHGESGRWMLVRRYVGLRVHARAGLQSGIDAHIDRDYRLPSAGAFEAFTRIAAHVS